MHNIDLIHKAASTIRPKRMKDGGLSGDVGCAVLGKNGKIYTGICGSSGSHTFCAEKIALGSMMTDGEYQFEKIVATWKDETGNVFVIPPCGNCRQLMRDIDDRNLESSIILDTNQVVSLKELLPYFDWWKKQ